MTAISFTVLGDPRPKQRPKHGKGFTYTPRETVLAEHTVKAHARRAKVRPIPGPVAIELRFYRATKRRCDWDNLAKLVCDALNGIAWRDDDQIVLALIGKAHDPENPRTEVTVQAFPVAESRGGGSWAIPDDVDAERLEATRRTKGEEPA